MGKIILNGQTLMETGGGASNVWYNPKTDTLQIYYNGEWVDWKAANLQAYYLFKSGIGLQNDITAQIASGWGTISITDNKIYCVSKNGYVEPTFSLDCSQFQGSGKSLYFEIMLDNSLSGTEDFIGFNTSITSSSSSSMKATSITNVAANKKTTISIDIDTYCIGSYKYPIFSLKNNNISIFNAYVK